jgi:hypothetical protein
MSPSNLAGFAIFGDCFFTRYSNRRCKIFISSDRSTTLANSLSPGLPQFPQINSLNPFADSSVALFPPKCLAISTWIKVPPDSMPAFQIPLLHSRTVLNSLSKPFKKIEIKTRSAIELFPSLISLSSVYGYLNSLGDSSTRLFRVFLPVDRSVDGGDLVEHIFHFILLYHGLPHLAGAWQVFCRRLIVVVDVHPYMDPGFSVLLSPILFHKNVANTVGKSYSVLDHFPASLEDKILPHIDLLVLDILIIQLRDPEAMDSDELAPARVIYGLATSMSTGTTTLTLLGVVVY